MSNRNDGLELEVMGEIFIELRGELLDFLPRNKRGQLLQRSFEGNPSIKHIIESFGIPHPEIGQIELSRQLVAFDYLVQDGDLASVYPFSPEHDHISNLYNASQLSIEPRFVLDNHLGKLATYLRMMGLDALYDKDFQDESLAEIAVGEERILLTRDRQLLMRKVIRWGYWARSQHPEQQLMEIGRKFLIFGQANPFHRCLRCNTRLQEIAKDEILYRLEPLTKKYFHDFRICPTCSRIYWKGSHYDRMQRLIARVKSCLAR